jgi:cation diffusion facilitator CzcD-associated flavoprotein CzcO
MSLPDNLRFNNQYHQPPRVPRVAIVGTGFVGSTTAYALLLSQIPAEIVLIDRLERRWRVSPLPSCAMNMRY